MRDINISFRISKKEKEELYTLFEMFDVRTQDNLNKDIRQFLLNLTKQFVEEGGDNDVQKTNA